MQVGMGWLGYTAEETLNTTVYDLLNAREGHIDYLVFTGVLKPKNEDPVNAGPPTPENFDRIAERLGRG